MDEKELVDLMSDIVMVYDTQGVFPRQWVDKLDFLLGVYLMENDNESQ